MASWWLLSTLVVVQVIILSSISVVCVSGWVVSTSDPFKQHFPTAAGSLQRTRTTSLSSISKGDDLSWSIPDDNNDEDDDDLTDITPKLGIDIGAMLDPFTPEEAAEIMAAAEAVVDKAIAEGVNEISALRERMKRELQAERKKMQLKSEMTTEQETKKLVAKIDTLIEGFLAETEVSRRTTKMAALADQSMAGGKGVDLGSWGVIGDRFVPTAGGDSSYLLGSVSAAQRQAPASSQDGNSNQPQQQQQGKEGVLIMADTSRDDCAKKLVPKLVDKLKSSLQQPDIQTFQPTATLPLGGDNAACVIIFCTSFSNPSSIKTAINDRLLRRTIQSDGSVGLPPTHLIAVSSVGTERTNKMPYTMQNLMSGGQLDQRRQMEELVVRTVKDRAGEPALDYTICKLGEIKPDNDKGVGSFQLSPGDVLDGSTTVDTAATIITQALAFQPNARNSTFSFVGRLDSENMESTLADAFLRLDGPELARLDILSIDDDSKLENAFESMSDYLYEWAFDWAEKGGAGLTTPVQAQVVPSTAPNTAAGVQKQSSLQLLFQPTATGKNYLSRNEELEREQQRQGASSSSSSAPKPRPKSLNKDGGVEMVIEIVQDPNGKKKSLRVRAKRCNYDGEDAVIKELSEETILSRLQKTVDVWKSNYK